MSIPKCWVVGKCKVNKECWVLRTVNPLYPVDVYTRRKFSVVTIPLTSVHVVVICGQFIQEQGGAAILAVR